MVEIRPQKGAQEQFLSSSADIAIYGGAAGGGKSWSLLYEPIRHIDNAGFGAVIFRRTTKQVRNEGGLWDESVKLYSLLGASPKMVELYWSFQSGATVSFAHLEYDKNVLDWQGSQIAYLGFDELTHFSAAQFWYMLSRNRSMCGVRPYVRASCNPDPDSFVRELIDWWIGEDGFPIKERGGVLRYFVRQSDKIEWAGSKQELIDLGHEADDIKSLTFVPASIYDNQKLLEVDKGYLANLKALPEIERARLLDGNWNVRNTKARVFDNYEVRAFETPEKVIHRFGADWGFANDPTVLIRAHIVGREIRIDHCVQGVGVEIDATPDLFDKVPGSRLYPVRADSARPETISYMRRRGFKMLPAIKGAGSIEEGVRFLKSYDIVVHPRCDPLLIEQLKNYMFKVDRDTGDILPILEDKHNDTIDALRYALEGLMRALRADGKKPRPPELPDYSSNRPKEEAMSWKTI